MHTYNCKTNKIPGTTYKDVYPAAQRIYKKYTSTTRRKPYVRSQYFKKDKIFLSEFWTHLRQKNWSDRTRRLKYLEPGLELIRHSTLAPTSKINPNNNGQMLHRFAGKTKAGDIFYVQIREDIKSDSKYLVSIFPEAKQKRKPAMCGI